MIYSILMYIPKNRLWFLCFRKLVICVSDEEIFAMKTKVLTILLSMLILFVMTSGPALSAGAFSLEGQLWPGKPGNPIIDEEILSFTEEDFAYLEPLHFSEDGLAVYNAMLPRVLVIDTNPKNQGIKFPQSPEVSAAIADPSLSQASIQITYKTSGTDPWGRNCVPFPAEVKTAFDAAAAIWESRLESAVPIRISACWTSELPSGVLGSSGANPIRKNFTNAPTLDTWYLGSLANSLAGSDLDPSKFDMHISYSSKYDWYFGTDGNPPADQFDFLSVAAHEICHGLNYMGSSRYSDQSGLYVYGFNDNPLVWDTFIEGGDGTKLTSLGFTDSSTLGTFFTSNDLWWNGPHAKSANGGSRVKIYAPSEWRSGSSLSHLDFDTYKPPNPNSLMVWSIGRGSAQHDPGPVTLGILEDMGWNARPDPQPDPTPEPTQEPTPDPTPEPTPEPTPDPQPGANLTFLPLLISGGGDAGGTPNPLINGDFDAGRGVGWTESSTNQVPLIVHRDEDIVTPHSGNYYSWLSGVYWANETSQISQQVTIPTNQSNLDFYYGIWSTVACGADKFNIKINGTTVRAYDLCQPNNTNNWVHAVVDLSAYQGSTVTLMFEATTYNSSGDKNVYSSLFLDTVSLSAATQVGSMDWVPVGASLPSGEGNRPMP
jgi:hypothetical protein